MKLTLLALCPSPNDSTSFYRGMGPLSHLRRHGEMSAMFVQQYSWSTMAMADAVFLQRPYLPEHLQIAEMAKDMNKPLWVDFDDDLFSVPEDNPAFRIYGKKETQKTIATIAAMADAVTTSTPFLAERMAKLNKNIRAIPNALNEDLFSYRDANGLMKNKLALWRGSDTHQRDLGTYSPEIIEAARGNKDWTWTFLGYNPWFITSVLPKNNCVVMEPIDVIQYHKAIHKMRPAFVHVPLHNNVFNMSKSNIAWLEAMFAGSVAIVPDWPEWQVPGACLYKNAETFGATVAAVIEQFASPSGRQSLAQLNGDGWAHIQEHLTLAKVNRQRAELLFELTGKKVM